MSRPLHVFLRKIQLVALERNWAKRADAAAYIGGVVALAVRLCIILVD